MYSDLGCCNAIEKTTKVVWATNLTAADKALAEELTKLRCMLKTN